MKSNLLHLLEKNGGALDRGAINAALQEMVTEGLVEVHFNNPGPPKTIADHTNYEYRITKEGQEALAAAKRKAGAVTIKKLKNDRATKIGWKGDTYILQPQPVGKGR